MKVNTWCSLSLSFEMHAAGVDAMTTVEAVDIKTSHSAGTKQPNVGKKKKKEQKELKKRNQSPWRRPSAWLFLSVLALMAVSLSTHSRTQNGSCSVWAFLNRQMQSKQACTGIQYALWHLSWGSKGSFVSPFPVNVFVFGCRNRRQKRGSFPSVDINRRWLEAMNLCALVFFKREYS